MQHIPRRWQTPPQHWHTDIQCCSRQWSRQGLGVVALLPVEWAAAGQRATRAKESSECGAAGWLPNAHRDRYQLVFIHRPCTTSGNNCIALTICEARQQCFFSLARAGEIDGARIVAVAVPKQNSTIPWHCDCDMSCHIKSQHGQNHINASLQPCLFILSAAVAAVLLSPQSRASCSFNLAPHSTRGLLTLRAIKEHIKQSRMI